MTGELNEKIYEYESEYGKVQLRPWINSYANNGNLAVGFDWLDDEVGDWQPFCYATVNLMPLPYLESAIDTNDNGNRFLDFLEEKGFGQRTGMVIPSGFCMFPVFRFNEERIREIDPEFFRGYQMVYGVEIPPLEAQISSAEALKETPEHSAAAEEIER